MPMICIADNKSTYSVQNIFQVAIKLHRKYVSATGAIKLWLSLIAELDCGLDRWTGLLDWITGSNQTASKSDDACVAH